MRYVQSKGEQHFIFDITAFSSGPRHTLIPSCRSDVDRNDKSRICAPGSVKVIGRRQIEMYSKLIHTVDHVEGYLREGFDALELVASKKSISDLGRDRLPQMQEFLHPAAKM